MKHNEIRSLIAGGHLKDYEIRKRFFNLTMTIYFDNHKPVNIKKSRWEDYWEILDKAEAEKV